MKKLKAGLTRYFILLTHCTTSIPTDPLLFVNLRAVTDLQKAKGALGSWLTPALPRRSL